MEVPLRNLWNPVMEQAWKEGKTTSQEVIEEDESGKMGRIWSRREL